MYKIDLNCDLGEGFGVYKMGNDEEILKYITSANIACGFHAGDPKIMHETVKLSLLNNVAIGAHPGLPDLAGFGRRNINVSPDEIYDMVVYIVYMIGFAPGFPYLGGMSKEIAVPRRESPRRSVPKGSVGIAGMQTGVYPIRTPGGWQIIGNTPKVLFSPSKCPPSILRPGDVVRFYPISSGEYDKYKESENWI